MLWVIGDIHGMIGPLTRLLDGIREYERSIEKTDKLIFLGDYIDHGLNSKEVIDALIEIPEEKVFLAGNHDDLAIRFFRNDTSLRDAGFMEWFNDGAYQTLTSLLSGTDKLNIFKNLFRFYQTFPNQPYSLFDGTRPDEKYLRFLENLKYSHKETFNYSGRTVGFRFFHSVPRLDQTLDEQMIDDFDDFQRYMKRPFPHLDSRNMEGDGQFAEWEKVSNGALPYPDGTIIWNRLHNFRYASEGEVVIHGHTPTLVFEKFYYEREYVASNFREVFQKYPAESRLPFLFSRGKGAGYRPAPDTPDPDIPKGMCFFDCGENGAVEEINVDTGAAYKWGALTALGLSESLLSRGLLPTLSAFVKPSDNPQRQAFYHERLLQSIPSEDHAILRVVQTGPFGADIKDTVNNPVFPFAEFRRRYG
jgi:hypothetical protein